MRSFLLISALLSLVLNIKAAQAASIPGPRSLTKIEARLYDKEVDRRQTEEDIKNLCTDKGGVALWRPSRNNEDVAKIDSVGDLQNYDSAMVKGAELNWIYGARLAAMRAVAVTGTEKIREMFSLDGKSLKDSGWCMLPDDNKSLTISAGGKSKTYEGEDYKKMLAEVGAITNVGDRPTKWVYLLGKALKEWHTTDKPENEIDDIKEAQKHLIAYCEILTGKVCVVTGNYYDEDSGSAQWVVQDSNKEVGKYPVMVIMADDGDVNRNKKGIWPIEYPDQLTFSRAPVGFNAWDYTRNMGTQGSYPMRFVAVHVKP